MYGSWKEEKFSLSENSDEIPSSWRCHHCGTRLRSSYIQGVKIPANLMQPAPLTSEATSLERSFDDKTLAKESSWNVFLSGLLHVFYHVAMTLTHVCVWTLDSLCARSRFAMPSIDIDQSFRHAKVGKSAWRTGPSLFCSSVRTYIISNTTHSNTDTTSEPTVFFTAAQSRAGTVSLSSLLWKSQTLPSYPCLPWKQRSTTPDAVQSLDLEGDVASHTKTSSLSHLRGSRASLSSLRAPQDTEFRLTHDYSVWLRQPCSTRRRDSAAGRKNSMRILHDPAWVPADPRSIWTILGQLYMVWSQY